MEIKPGDEEPQFSPGGIATEFVQPITSSQRFEPLDGMVIEGCRWRAPGYISVDANWLGDEVEDLPIGLVLWRGDQGFGGGGLVTLSGPGQFSVTFDFNGVPLWTGEVDQIENELGDIEIGRNGFTRYAGDECSLEQLPPVSVPLTWDPVPQSVTAVEGSAEWLAQSLDVRDADVGLLPFAYFMAYRGWNGFDRIHVAPNQYMTSMNVEFRPFAAIVAFEDTIEGDSDPFQSFGRCAEIRSDYDVDGDTVSVYELYGCEPLPRWIDDPATIQADEPGDLRGVRVDAAPGEFVAVVGTSAAVEEVANDVIRAPITDAAP